MLVVMYILILFYSNLLSFYYEKPWSYIDWIMCAAHNGELMGITLFQSIDLGADAAFRKDLSFKQSCY